jgi:phosphoenolpyruvate carboxykinase (GTP)
MPESLDTVGPDLSVEALAACLDVDPVEWRAELPLVEEWFDRLGEAVPASLWAEFDALRLRLGA